MRFGLLLDEKTSELLLELSLKYNSEPYELIHNAIQTMWKAHQRKLELENGK